MKSRELNECSFKYISGRPCGNTEDIHSPRNIDDHFFVPVVVWELSEAEVKLLKEVKK